MKVSHDVELARGVTNEHPILIVDGDPDFLSIVTASMAAAGWQFEVATAGQPAISKLATSSFAAVLLDLNLPDISGLDVLRAIRDLSNAPPVVFISGDASVVSAFEAGQLQAVGFLEKPVTMSNLLAKLADTIQRRSSKVLDASAENQPRLETRIPAQIARLATVLVRASHSPDDFRNSRGLAKVGNVGHGTLRRWCRYVDVPGRPLIRYARGFWAVRRGLELKCPPADLLDLASSEALSLILDPHLPLGTTEETYCRSQQHLPAAHPLVLACLALSIGPRARN